MLPLFLSLGIGATVVIDPGHGGYQPGARADKGRYEKQLTLEVAEAAKAELIRRGHTVFLTRTHDQYVPLGARSRFANEHHADVMLSIHANDAPRSPDASGIETYFLAPRATDAEAQALAEKENDDPNAEVDAGGLLGTILSDLKRTNAAIESELLAARVQGALVRATGAKSRGVKQAPLAVLKRTEMAAILVEIGFITSRSEREKLWSRSYQSELATGFADGIERFLNDSQLPELPPPAFAPLISLTHRQKAVSAKVAKVAAPKKKKAAPAVAKKAPKAKGGGTKLATKKPRRAPVSHAAR